MLNINIENEYSRLKTVILGIADNLGNPPSESDAFDPRSLYHIKNNSYPLEEDLKKEVESFKKKLTKHNVEVLRPNNVNDCNQIFARDLGFVISNMFFLSNIVPNRQDEIEGIKEILNHLNVGVIKLPEFMHIEGGDIIVHNDKVFIGTYSEEDYPSLITARTNNESIDYLKRIINNKEIIPELIQKECNAKEIYNSVVYFLKNPELMKKQIRDCEETLTKIRSKSSSSDEAASVLTKFLIS